MYDLSDAGVHLILTAVLESAFRDSTSPDARLRFEARFWLATTGVQIIDLLDAGNPDDVFTFVKKPRKIPKAGSWRR